MDKFGNKKMGRVRKNYSSILIKKNNEIKNFGRSAKYLMIT